MRPSLRVLVAIAAASTVTAFAVPVSSAAPRPDVSFVSGGVTTEDFQLLRSEAGRYSLELLLAASGSGAYLADVEVVIASLPDRAPVLRHRTDGPVMLASLPPGLYEITATCDEVLPDSPRTITRVVRIPRAGRVQQVLYFNTGDDVVRDRGATRP